MTEHLNDLVRAEAERALGRFFLWHGKCLDREAQAVRQAGPEAAARAYRELLRRGGG